MEQNKCPLLVQTNDNAEQNSEVQTNIWNVLCFTFFFNSIFEMCDPLVSFFVKVWISYIRESKKCTCKQIHPLEINLFVNLTPFSIFMFQFRVLFSNQGVKQLFGFTSPVTTLLCMYSSSPRPSWASKNRIEFFRFDPNLYVQSALKNKVNLLPFCFLVDRAFFSMTFNAHCCTFYQVFL